MALPWRSCGRGEDGGGGEGDEGSGERGEHGVSGRAGGTETFLDEYLYSCLCRALSLDVDHFPPATLADRFSCTVLPSGAFEDKKRAAVAAMKDTGAHWHNASRCLDPRFSSVCELPHGASCPSDSCDRVHEITCARPAAEFR